MKLLPRWIALAVPLALLTAFTYWPTIDAPFLFDDIEGIVRNPNVQALAPSEGQSRSWTAAFTAPGGTGASGRPLVASSLAVDYARGGLEPRVFRTTNLLVLFMAGLSLALLAFQAAQERVDSGMKKRAISIAAFFTAALWIVHPLHGSAIHQVIYRGELMMTLAFFATLLFAQIGFSRAQSSRRWLFSSVLCCGLGMLSKENMAAAPLVCLLWDRSQESSYGLVERLRARPLYYAGLAGTWILLAIAWISGDRGEAVGLGARDISSLDYLSTQASVVATYASWSLFPFDLAFDYSDWPIATSLIENALEGCFVLVLLVLCIFATCRRSLLGLAGLASFLVLAPTSTVFPIAVSIAAEHRLTLPLAAFTAAVSFGLMHFSTRRGTPGQLLGTLGLAALCATCLLGSRARNRQFVEPRELWSTTVGRRPMNILARSHLVEELQRAGELESALEQIDASLAVRGDQPELRWNQGLILSSLGRTVESEAALRDALFQDGSLAARQMHEAMRAWSEGRIAEALHQLRVCLSLEPELARRDRLGTISLQAARAFAVASEESLFRPGLALQITEHLPAGDLRVLEARAAALAALGRFGEAEGALDEALSIARSQRNQRASERVSRRAKLYAAGRFERRAVTR